MHQGRRGDRPSIAGLSHLEFRQYLGIGQENLVEGGIPVHLPQGLCDDAGLAHVDYEIGQARMLSDLHVGAGKQESPMRLVGTCGPYLLPVHNPFVADHDGARRRAGKVGATARLTEQLAPDVFTGDNPAQEHLLVHVSTVIEDRGSSEHTDAGFRDRKRTDPQQFLLDERDEGRRKVSAVPCDRPVRHAPPGLGQFGAPLDKAEPGVPVFREPGTQFGPHPRFRYVRSSFNSPSFSPVPYHALTMMAGIAEKHLRTFRPLEPEMGIIVPGEPDTAMHLNRMNRRLHIGFRSGCLGE